jgi:hypothetical protein
MTYNGRYIAPSEYQHLVRRLAANALRWLARKIDAPYWSFWPGPGRADQ